MTTQSRPPLIPFSVWAYPKSLSRKMADLTTRYLTWRAPIDVETHHILTVLSVTAVISPFTHVKSGWNIEFSIHVLNSNTKKVRKTAHSVVKVNAKLTNVDMSRLLVYMGFKQASELTGCTVSFLRARRLDKSKTQTSPQLLIEYLQTWHEARELLL